MTNRERAAALLKTMTLTEKIGQLSLMGMGGLDEQGVPENKVLFQKVAEGKCGFVIQLNGDYAQTTRELQRIAVEETRCKIPLLFNADVIHGLETVFPIPLAAACSFDCELVEKTAKAAAKEAAAYGIHYTNAPMVDVSRDPRWGRICESQGEDPYLAGEMAKAYVRGFQNEESYVMATLKHYAAYGACEGGRDYDVAEVCENTMLNAYLIPFREGVKAGADSVMSSFNCIENVPASGNKKYLKDILRGRFGFKGIVLSDAMSVPEMMAHGYCETPADCAYRAMKAGLDVELGTDCYEMNLSKLVQEGAILETEIDEAVLRVLEKKFELGLFDDPYKYFGYDRSAVYCEKHLALSEKLAGESVVLLENNGVLPLRMGAKLALVGPFARNRDFCGAWQDSSRQKDSTTLEEAFLSQGFELTGISEDYNLMRAEEVTYGADVVIFAIGEAWYESGEAHSKYDIGFSSECAKCFHYLKSRGKEVVTLVFAGRPMIVNDFKYADALAFCWHLGQRTADATVKLLSGALNFSGKLCVTVPRTTGQLPINYNRKNVGRPYLPDRQDYRFQVRYDDGENFPQYVFGYGLSYSAFSYGEVSVCADAWETEKKLTVTAEVRNEGSVDGVETVQLYLRDPFAEVVRPNRELKGFQRVFLRAGERKTVTFELNEESLSYYHSDGRYFADGGEYIVYVGGNSSTQNQEKFYLKPISENDKG